MDKCCQTCEHWGAGRFADWGPCLMPIPFYIEVTERETTYRRDGANCPCYQKREASEA